MTRRAIKNILQSETTVNSWWHEREDPNHDKKENNLLTLIIET